MESTIILDDIGRLIQEINYLENTKPTTDDHFKFFFPKLHSKVKGDLSKLFPEFGKMKINREEMARFDGKVQNLNAHIYTEASKDISAYTIPGLTVETSIRYEGLPENINVFLDGMRALQRMKFDGKLDRKTGKVVFNSPKNFTFLMFQTKGLENLLDFRLRFAVQLHEIGHWTRVGGVIKGRGLWDYWPLFLVPPFSIIMSILFLSYGRASEYDADMFAKEVGYGKEMQEALYVLHYGKGNKEAIRKEIDAGMVGIVDIISSIEDMIGIALTSIPLIGPLFIPSDYPEVNRRIDALQESYDPQLLQEIDVNWGLVKNKFITMLQTILIPIDASLSSAAANLYWDIKK